MHLWIYQYEDGGVWGEGVDDLDRFTLHGGLGEVGELRLLKEYRRYPPVPYVGVVADWGIRGRWRLPELDGDFMLWPVGVDAPTDRFSKVEMD